MAQESGFEKELKNSYELVWINSEEIYVDPEIQRDVSRRGTQFRYIMAHYNPYLAQPITVSRISGRWQCIDGQMTMATMIAQNGGRPLRVPCRVLPDMTEDEAARMFYLQRGCVCALVADDAIRVEYFHPHSTNSGWDVAGAQQAMANQGWSYGFEDDGLAKVRARKTATVEYGKFQDKGLYEQVWQIIGDAWDISTKYCPKHIIEALSHFVRTYPYGFDESTLARKLSKTTPQAIRREAERKDVFHKDRVKNESYQIMLIYNDRRKNDKLDQSVYFINKAAD